jgi:hypothetical protein
MSLSLHLRVLWRFRWIVLLGTLASVALTFLSVFHVDWSTRKLTYRSSEQWTSYARIFVTQPGFPYGAVNTGGADPTTLAANAILYSQFANSDPVRRLSFGAVKPPGDIVAAPVLASANSSDALPIVSIAATADSKPLAIELARKEMTGLILYVRQQQQAADIGPTNRIVLQVIGQPQTAALVKGRSKTLPIVVFLFTMLAVVGLALILENLRPLVVTEDVKPVSFPQRSNVA